MVQSSSSSGIFFQADGQSQVAERPNFSNTLPGGNVDHISGACSYTVFNSVESSGPNNQASSLVTDANSGLSGGPHMQRSSSFNMESYMRLPASPISFSSNNIAMSGSCTMDGSSVVQPSPSRDQLSQQRRGRGRSPMGGSCAASVPGIRLVQFANHQRMLDSIARDVNTVPRLQKRPRLDIKQEDIVQQQVLQRLLQRQDSMHLQNSNPQLQALIQEQRLRQQEQQQQFLQAMTPSQRVQFLQQNQQHFQLSKQLQVQGVPPACVEPRPSDGGVCSRRLMQYLYHERQRPADNSIAYWRKFVAEYYSPRSKKKLCLSRYNNVGHRSAGVIPQGEVDAWQCDLCGSSERGFEVTFEVLPRLQEVKFSSGMIDELLFLDLPRELRFASGIMMLEYAKAVQESVYEQVRVVREGQLRIIFNPDLKILSWDFCARRHEEFLPRRLIAPQVNQLLQVAQTCHSTLTKNGAEGISQSDLKSSSVMVVAAGRQLAKILELQSLNDLGFSKRYVRCLQLADVVNRMKDLMNFCRDYKQGPLEGLKNFTGRATIPDVETDQTGGLQGLPTNPNNLMAFSHMNNINQLVNNRRALSGSPQASVALTNRQNMLTRQNSINSTNSPILNELFSSNQAQSSSMPGPSRHLTGLLPNGILLQQYLQGMGEKYDGRALYSQGGNGYGPSGLGFRNEPVAGQGGRLSGSSSFKAPSSENMPSDDLTRSHYVMDEMGFVIDSGFFNNNFDGNVKFGQKM